MARSNWLELHLVDYLIGCSRELDLRYLLTLSPYIDSNSCNRFCRGIHQTSANPLFHATGASYSVTAFLTKGLAQHKSKIALPYFFTENSFCRLSRHVIIKLLPLQKTLNRLSRSSSSRGHQHFNNREPSTVILRVMRRNSWLNRRNHILVATKLTQVNLNARSGSFLGFNENKFVFMETIIVYNSGISLYHRMRIYILIVLYED